MGVSDQLAEYLSNSQLSVSQVAMDTGVPEEKLYPGTSLSLEAAEFLELCSYLHIKPEMFYEGKKGGSK